MTTITVGKSWIIHQKSILDRVVPVWESKYKDFQTNPKDYLSDTEKQLFDFVNDFHREGLEDSSQKVEMSDREFALATLRSMGHDESDWKRWLSLTNMMGADIQHTRQMLLYADRALEAHMKNRSPRKVLNEITTITSKLELWSSDGVENVSLDEECFIEILAYVKLYGGSV